MRRIISIFVTALLLASIVACSDTSSHKRGNRNNDNVEFSEVKNVVYTKYGIPLPVDLFTYMVKQEVLFNYDLLIPLENREKYTKSKAKQRFNTRNICGIDECKLELRFKN